MSAAAVQSLNVEMPAGGKTIHPFFTGGSVVARHADPTPDEDMSFIPDSDQSVDSKGRRRSKRLRPVEEVMNAENCTQGNLSKANGTSVSEPVSQTKRRKVSREVERKETGARLCHLTDSGLENVSGKAASAEDSSGMKASSDAGVLELDKGASKRKRGRKTRTTLSNVAGNVTNCQPYVIVDIAGHNQESYPSKDEPCLKKDVELPSGSACPTACPTQDGSTDTQAPNTTGEDCLAAEAKGAPPAGSSQDAEAKVHATVANPSGVQMSVSESAKSSHYAPIFLPKRRSPSSATDVTKPSSTSGPRKRRSGRQGASVQADSSSASSGCRDIPKRRRLIVILRYRLGSRITWEGSEREQESIITKDITNNVVDLTVSPRPENGKRTSKPVHPFFLGRTTSKQLDIATNKSLHRLNADANLSDDKQLTSGSDTERGVKGISRKVDSTNKSRPLGFITGLGGATLGAGICKGVVKFPGVVEALWPPKDMVHIRDLESGYEHGQETKPESFQVTTLGPYPTRGQQKQKQNALQIPQQEDILHSLAQRLVPDTHDTPLAGPESDGQKPHLSRALRLPERTVLTGSALRVLVRQELRSPISAIDRGSSEVAADDPQGFNSNAMERHPTLLRLYRSIGKSFTPFDLDTCETQQWSIKYAPSSAEDVLQPGKEAMFLRHWLQNVALSSTDTSKSKSKRQRRPSSTEKQSGAVHKHKPRRVVARKRRADELCDFIVSSEDEDDGMEELSGPDEEHEYPPISRSVVRGGGAAASETGQSKTRAANCMLISGPSGCGKTAAAYAVAKELGFEVFEINSGSRRSGKDLLEKVGDVTINHLIRGNNAFEAGATPQILGSAVELDTGKSTSIGSFFKSKQIPRLGAEKPSKSESSTDPPTQHQTTRVQKQSLILLEEVDVLFEEDKTFWAAVLGLLSQSRRPIIMTCEDENLIPTGALPLHGILRFRPPPIDLAVDYLLLLAGAEGHLLRRSAVEALYRSKHRDLRASIMEIDFWCQMAVGDQKAGLEWMHPRCPSWDDGFAGLDALHVASKDTYLTGMGWTGRDAVTDEAGHDYAVEQELLHEAWNNWDVDVEDWHSGSDIDIWANSFAFDAEDHSRATLAASCAADQFYDRLSAADVFAGHALAVGDKIPLDTTQPVRSDLVRYDTVQGYSLLEVDPADEHDGLSTDLALYAKLAAKRLLRAIKDEHAGDTQPHMGTFNQADLIELVTSKAQPQASSRDQLTRHDLSSAFDPISEASSATPTAPGALQCSEFDRTSSVIVEDLAPYVRAIVLHDVQLEDQRRQIQEQSSKRLRMTRASRSALEGGSRSSMRRDKWFEGNLDPTVVLKTGSHEWYRAAAK
ncbi:MAG: hypothetical protein M1816_000987 [Peltula sp. TS41687]|nr:MAG: hypothetical protein M1816_000987 [Peltula sp. TS41687]